MRFNHPLMHNNFTRADMNAAIKLLKAKNNILTQSKNVDLFEKRWSKWLGVKYSIFVNSGSSANFLTMAILKILYGKGEIILPTLTPPKKGSFKPRKVYKISTATKITYTMWLQKYSLKYHF